MAAVTRHYANLTLGDSASKRYNFRIRVNSTDGQAWLEAADPSARAATDIGVMFGKVMALTALNLEKSSVTLEDTDDAFAFPAPDSNIYGFDKLATQLKAGLKNYTLTIPGRDDAAYNVSPDGLTVLIDGAGASAATTEFITALEAVMLADNGDTVNVQGMRVAS